MRSGKDALREVVLKTSSEDCEGGGGLQIGSSICKGSLAGKNDDGDDDE